MAEPHWEQVQRTPIYELVIEQIEKQLIAGTLGPGDRLPPERELAATLGASRQAVREALRVLQAQGVLRAQQGTGAGSGTVVVPAPARALARLLKLHLAISSFPQDDLTEARVMLERTSASAAALRRADADLDRLHAELDAMDADLSREDLNPHDTAFHVAIADSGGNRLVGELTAAIRESLRGRLLDAMLDEPDWPGLRAGLRAEHRAILAAIRAGDPDAAADLVEQHIRRFHRRLS